MSDDERAIREVIRTWLEASAAGDTDRVLALMTDDVVFLTPGREPFGKQAFAEASRASAGKVRFEGTSEAQEETITGDTAFCRTRLRVTVTPLDGGEAKKLSGHTLSVFRRQPDGRWLLARDANLLAPEPQTRSLRSAVPVLQVASVARSMDWYRDALGFTADPFGPSAQPVFAILNRDGVEVMLQRRHGEASTAIVTRPELRLDAYIRVHDVQTVRKAMLEKVPDAAPIVTREYGCLEFSVTDPDGHVLVFGECG